MDTILFDLDGTLLPLGQDEFIKLYFSELGKTFSKAGLDSSKAVKSVWEGTKAMTLNDGRASNHQRFWETFAASYGIGDESRLREVEGYCDYFYANEFNNVADAVKDDGSSSYVVRLLKDKGYEVVLATNPIFPYQAAVSRLNWINLRVEDFAYITTYTNSSYCKPNHAYFLELLGKLKKTVDQCLMVGNNIIEDMSYAQLGGEVYLITDHLENEAGLTYDTFSHGSMADFRRFAESLPVL